MSSQSVAVLCGGFGAARFLTGLRDVANLSCVVNTADDVEHAGVHVSPDIDSVVYALADRFDEECGWGLKNDTFVCAEALARFDLGWFQIGDGDLATCLWRTRLLRQGVALSDVCRLQTAAFGIAHSVLPMTDQPVRTIFETEHGELAFQEHVVLHGGAPRILGVRLAGIENAVPAPGVLELLSSADTILIAPSNPVTSIGPILALPGVSDVLARRRERVVAVSPVVVGRAPVTPPEQGRARLREAVFAARGLPHSPVSAAALWEDVAAGFVLDQSDQASEPEIRALSLETLVVDTLPSTPAGRSRLAESVLAFARRLGVEAPDHA